MMNSEDKRMWKSKSLDVLRQKHENYSPEAAETVNLMFIPSKTLRHITEILDNVTDFDGKRDFKNFGEHLDLTVRQVLAIKNRIRNGSVTWEILRVGADNFKTYLDVLSFFMKYDIYGLEELIKAWPETLHACGMHHKSTHQTCGCQSGVEASWNCPSSTSGQLNDLSVINIQTYAESVFSDSNNENYHTGESETEAEQIQSQQVPCSSVPSDVIPINRRIVSWQNGSFIHRCSSARQPIENSTNSTYSSCNYFTDREVGNSVNDYENREPSVTQCDDIINRPDDDQMHQTVSKSVEALTPVVDWEPVQGHVLSSFNQQAPVLHILDEDGISLEHQQPSPRQALIYDSDDNMKNMKNLNLQVIDVRPKVHADIFPQKQVVYFVTGQTIMAPTDGHDIESINSDKLFGFGKTQVKNGFIQPSEVSSIINASVSNAPLLSRNQNRRFLIITGSGEKNVLKPTKQICENLKQENISFLCDLPGEILNYHRLSRQDEDDLKANYTSWLKRKFYEACCIIVVISKDYKKYVGNNPLQTVTDVTSFKRRRHRANQKIVYKLMKKEIDANNRQNKRFQSVLVNGSQRQDIPMWLQDYSSFYYQGDNFKESNLHKELNCRFFR